MYLKLENIQKKYDEKVAVDKLSLDIPQGEIFGIIGPNGAGKTTTIRMIMNITVPDEGRIIFKGEPVGDDFKDQVGYLPEERGLYKKLTCREVVKYMAALKGYTPADIDKKIEAWLQKVELFDYIDKKVEELSKGMQQKLQFVTTIIHEPEIVILDEIFSGLDPLNIELIKNILLDLKRQGKTILFSTHVMEQAEKLCDYICMFNRGKKVLDGRLTEIKSKHGQNRIQLDIDGDGYFISSLPGVSSMREFNNYIEIEIKQGTDTNQLLRSILEKVQVRKFDMVEPSLYDIFIQTANIDPDEYYADKEADHV